MACSSETKWLARKRKGECTITMSAELVMAASTAHLPPCAEVKLLEAVITFELPPLI